MRLTGRGLRAAKSRHSIEGFSLVELLVVLAIIAAASTMITTAVVRALQQQDQRACLTNMLTIEAAKDEYVRDHPGATSIPDIATFRPYFRFGIPRCPNNPNSDYVNLLDLTKPVICSVHGTIKGLSNGKASEASSQ
jgi:prepilin-type N-terminal cleavage/methylation domain-containing protein